MADDIWQVIRGEHQTVSDLLAEVQRAAVEEREKLFLSIFSELQLHAEAEEALIYPLLAEEAEDLADAAEDAHEQVVELLEKLAELEVDDDAFMGGMVELLQAVQAHVTDEETRIIPVLEKKIDAKQNEQLSQEWNRLKQATAAGDDRQHQIAVRAYEIWEREGRPEGRHLEHWREAERQVREETSEDAAAVILPDPLT